MALVSPEHQKPARNYRWLGKLTARLVAYTVAVALLGFAAVRGWYGLTIVFALAVGGIGVWLHIWLNHKPLRGTTKWRTVALAVLVVVGFLICISSQWHVFGWRGFIGLSFIGFGASQLAAELRETPRLNRYVAAALLACVLVATIGLFFGFGGWPLFAVGLLLIPPMLSLCTSAVLDVLQARGEVNRPPWIKRFAWVAPTIVFLVGAVWLGWLSWWIIAVPVAAVLLLFVGMMASDTDADIAFVLVILAVVWSQFPRSVVASTPAGSKSILAIGDSYISGEGAQLFYAGTNTATRRTSSADQCRRSPTSYPVLVAKDQSAHLDFLACSGAVVSNVITGGEGQYVGENPRDQRASPAPGQPLKLLSQLDRYDLLHRQSKPDLVLVSIGGNDVDFGTIVQTCLAPGDCSARGQEWLDKLVQLRPNLDRLYSDLWARFGDAVLVIPYPIPIRETACAPLRSTLTADEHRFVYMFVSQLDLVIEQEAVKNHLHFVPTVPTAFAPGGSYSGGRFCDVGTRRTAVNYLGFSPVGVTSTRGSGCTTACIPTSAVTSVCATSSRPG